MRVPADMRRKPVQQRKRRKHRRSSAWRTLGKWLLLLLAVLLLLSLLMVLPFRWVEPPTTAFILQDDSGRDPPLYEWIDWSDIGTAMPLAVVAAEDQRFADHFGLDLGSIRDSIEEARAGGPLRGASTIPQQLVKNLYLSPDRSFLRKGIEAWLALLADLVISKQRLLELYVNVIELGPGIYGVGAASEVYFGKTPANLTDAEAALLAAVLPNPVRLQVNAPSDYVRERQAWILRQMARLRRESWLMRL